MNRDDLLLPTQRELRHIVEALDKIREALDSISLKLDTITALLSKKPTVRLIINASTPTKQEKP